MESSEIIELIVAAVLIVLILGFAASVTIFSFIIYPRMMRRAKEKQFPLVTKQGLRVSKIPIRTITLEDIERGVELFIIKAVAKGYDEAKMRTEFKTSYLELIRAVNEEGARYIIDQYGRKIAGDNNMQTLRIVVIDQDTWEKTAGFHEFGHLGHETKGKVDYDHTDDIMWHEVVGACKKEFAS
jgi:hypothetical protein